MDMNAARMTPPWSISACERKHNPAAASASSPELPSPRSSSRHASRRAPGLNIRLEVISADVELAPLRAVSRQATTGAAVFPAETASGDPDQEGPEAPARESPRPGARARLLPPRA